jgi:hypothetical protein
MITISLGFIISAVILGVVDSDCDSVCGEGDEKIKNPRLVVAACYAMTPSRDLLGLLGNCLSLKLRLVQRHIALDKGDNICSLVNSRVLAVRK